MARLYFLTSETSDLTGGLDFNLELEPNITSTASALSVSVAQAVTEVSYGYTSALDPGQAGSVVGNYTLSINVTSGAADMTMTFAVARVNSTGTQQTVSTASASMDLSTAGVKTATLSNINLGTFLSTDRLRVSYTFINGAAHNARTVGINRNSVDSYILTPFRAKYFITT